MVGTNRISLASEDRALGVALLEEMSRAHQLCAAERKRLHAIEWADGADSGSVLGEAEVRATYVAGAWDAISRRVPAPVDPAAVAAWSIHQSKALGTWLEANALSFPELVAYLQSIEHLRSVIPRIL